MIFPFKPASIDNFGFAMFDRRVNEYFPRCVTRWSEVPLSPRPSSSHWIPPSLPEARRSKISKNHKPYPWRSHRLYTYIISYLTYIYKYKYVYNLIYHRHIVYIYIFVCMNKYIYIICKHDCLYNICICQYENRSYMAEEVYRQVSTFRWCWHFAAPASRHQLLEVWNLHELMGHQHMMVSWNGGTPIAGCFISRKIQFKWMIIWGYPYFRKKPP